ncbi:AMP-binding protein [Geoalkalibacter halelectricus]|uniref:AMP-binding protein n=1 Tax=Geoalkalibacter halelectricus TaxID=2847045 RepID=A0ABY5ZGE1_9BACT|nr:AMP-binding protein [Geoalkalibacter halelectricus]MDO3380185.1 AMP-binding protein [Geoalkalibacter halelectricus]UWZ78242.1 AMP-binding protein [Geoalkalibacter halelectricus]
MGESSQKSSGKSKFKTLAHLIDALAEEGRKTAINALRKDDERQISRSRLREKVHQTAAALVESGVSKGQAVVLWAENSPQWIIACLAILRSGGRVVPLDVQLDRKALERILEDCDPVLLVTNAALHDRLKELSCDIPRTLFLDHEDSKDEDSLWSLQGGADLPEIGADDEATMFYTSGTTGPPKGVPLTHGNLIFQINRILATDLTRPDDRVLLPLPLHHVYPFVIGMFLPLAAKIPIILPYAMTGPQILRALRQAQVSVICGVPRLYRALYDAINQRIGNKSERLARIFTCLVQECARINQKVGWNPGKALFYPLRRRLGPHLRLLASGGSPLAPEMARFFEGLGWQVAIGYGLTETAPLLTLNPPDSGRYDSVGKAISGVQLKLDLDKGENEGEGEVLALGPNVFRGYYKMEEKSKEAFTSEGWFRTGDLGSIDDQGYLRLSGRASTLIVTESGKNINPEEVEEAYSQSSAIKEIGVLEDEGHLVALIVPETSDEEDQREHIKQALEEVAKDLPSYWQVTDFSLTSRSLPRTRLGKIRRHLLEEQYHKAQSGEKQQESKGAMALEDMSGEDRSLLVNSAARAVWDWLVERYAEKGLTPDTRLQGDLGIDSLEWLTVTVEVGERTGIELEEEVIAEVETVRDLLERVAAEEEEGSAGFSGEPLENPEEALSDEQKRWLQPGGAVMGFLRKTLYALNRLVVKNYFHVEVAGLENLPEGHFVLAPNHLSNLDAPVIAAILPKKALENTWWGGWTGAVFDNFLLKTLSHVANVVPVDPRRAVISSLAFGCEVLRHERNLVWFPEGQRSPDGQLRPFKAGIGMVLSRYPAPVVPVSIDGTFEVLPRGKFWPRRGRIRVVFGTARNPEEIGDAEETSQERAKKIARQLQEDVEGL